MEWSKNFSSRRAITVDTILEDEQDQMITQGLVISQQYSINELSKLEDEEMTEVDSPPSTSTSNRNIVITHIGGEDKRSGRISQMLDKLSNRARTPSPQPLSKKRTSVWLNELVFGDDTVSDPHPGVRQKRLSSVTTAQEPLQLLKRWTDHGEHYQRHYSIFDGSSTEKKDLFAESSFLFTDDLNNALTVKENAVDDHSISNLIDPIDKVKRVYTIPISPKTSISVNPKPKPQISRASIGISLPTIIENQDPSEIVYDEYLTSVLQNIGLHRESNSLFELFVTYGGQSRVLKSNDKPHLVFDQLQEFGLQPQFVLRRLPEFILEEVDDTLQLTEEPVSVE
ncbi:putative ste50-like protein [Phaeomoniella chlamydospora]|uniref:Putative ste50-like protein n=1 Tax=Phaeomoniella chlamydospora TaxID=158046 RepID=A0A0G2FYF5_PHACM|nr:putative ste50-like protein [Phaeomoniella chlamydospora]